MKCKHLGALLLLLHVLVHPAVHALPIRVSEGMELEPLSDKQFGVGRLEALRPCLGCASARNTLLGPVCANHLNPSQFSEYCVLSSTTAYSILLARAFPARASPDA